MLADLVCQLNDGVPLTSGQVAAAVTALVEEAVPSQVKATFLTALAIKGETAEEIAGFARALRERALQPELDPVTRAREILDVCGTGGDHLNTFNISTTVALVAASAGITVAKHGNRAITSRSGSADVLEALGVRTDLDPADAARWLKERGFAFFFAPKYHPAFKHIAPARKLCAERGQRTVFNLLGPLLNPVRPTAQLLGVPRPEFCEPIARVLQTLGVRRGMVVSGRVEAAPPPPTASAAGPLYLDELSTLGETTLAEFYHEKGVALATLAPTQLPVCPATLADLAGGDHAANAKIILALLTGEDRGPRRDAVLLNAAAALFVAGRCRSIAEGWALAEELIDSGQARRKLEELRQP
ncbi:MAG TPA: anthranilate phosphoribosyltransferase [Methylomirabilota bacterium]|nr:anthranilate phosphoribosyltransferase [Methylomirabilota bacterium]